MPLGMTGGAYQGGGAASFRAAAQAPPAPAPTPIIGAISVSSGVAGTVTFSWGITYSGDVTDYNFIWTEISSGGTTASGNWYVDNGSTSTPTVRFVTTAGDGGIAKFTVGIGACQNSGTNNKASSVSATGTATATPPTVTLSTWSNNLGRGVGTYGLNTSTEGNTRWIDVSYDGLEDAYNLVAADLEWETVSGSPAGSVLVASGGTTNIPVIGFANTNYGTMRMRVKAGAVQNNGVNNVASAWSGNMAWQEDGGK